MGTVRIRKAVGDKRALVEGGVLCWIYDPVEMGHFVLAYMIDHHVDQIEEESITSYSMNNNATILRFC